MHPPIQKPRNPTKAVAGAAETTYTASDDRLREPMTDTSLSRREPALRGPDARGPEALTRGEKILVPLFGAMLAAMVMGFVAIGGQLVAVQRDIGELRGQVHQEIGDLRTELSARLTRIETVLEIRHGEPAPPGAAPDANRDPEPPRRPAN